MGAHQIFLAVLAAVGISACATPEPAARAADLGVESDSAIGAAPRREPCGGGPILLEEQVPSAPERDPPSK